VVNEIPFDEDEEHREREKALNIIEAEKNKKLSELREEMMKRMKDAKSDSEKE